MGALRGLSILISTNLLVLVCLLLVIRQQTAQSPGIVFVSDRGETADLYWMHPDGSHLRRLTTTATYEDAPTWSTDGAWIAFSAPETGDDAIYMMRQLGSQLQRLTRNAPLPLEESPAWSPDGEWIVYEGYQDDRWDLFLVHVDGDQSRQLTFDPARDRDPAWSPDGQWIIFSSNYGRGYQLFRIRPDGSDQEALTFPPSVSTAPAWSPDGRAVYFELSSGNGSRIYRLDLAIMGASPIISTAQLIGFDQHPSPSPDGAWLAFESFRDGDWEIYRMRPDGSDVQRLTHSSGYDGQPAWGPIIDKSWHWWVLGALGIVGLGWPLVWRRKY